MFLAVAAAALAGAWIMLAPQSAPVTSPARSVQLEIRLAGDAVIGPDALRVSQGDQVRLIIHSDRADEVHLHGYDLTAALQPGQTSTLEFVADRSGRFELELHADHRAIGALAVHPAP